MANAKYFIDKWIGNESELKSTESEGFVWL